jgi:ABC-type multidrug transport system permease subunit
MNQMKHVWYIALNNLRIFMRDRLALGMFILFPFLFIIMFNILLANVGSEDTRLVLHLVTQENGGISSQIIQAMETRDEAQLKPGEPRIVWDKDYSQAKADVETGKMDGFLAFPADFTQGIQLGYGSTLEIVSKPDATNTRMALNGLAQGIISRTAAQKVEINSAIALLSQQSMAGGDSAGLQAAIAQIFGSQSENSPVQALVSYQIDKVGEVKPMNASSYVVPGYLVMFVFFAAAMSAVELVRERKNHTLERMLALSVNKSAILGGAYLGTVLKGLLQIIIFWGFGILVFKIDVGVAPWAVVALSLLVVLMSAAFSVMLATLVRTERAGSSLAVLISLILAPLGGCWWPLFITPHWMQFIAKFTPHGWATAGFAKLLVFGAEGNAVMGEMLVLAGFAVVFIIIAILNFRTSAEAT